MNGSPNPTGKTRRWQTLVVGLSTFLFVTTSVFIAWRLLRVSPNEVLIYGLLLGCFASFALLLFAGIALLHCRQQRWGWCVLAFTTAACLLFLFVLMPWLAKARAYA